MNTVDHLSTALMSGRAAVRSVARTCLLAAMLVGASAAASAADANQAKISSALWPVVDGDAAGAPVAKSVSDHLTTVTVAAPVGSYSIRLDVPVTDANLAAIVATGAVVVSSSVQYNTVIVSATPAQIRALAALDAVSAVVLNRKPRHRATKPVEPGTYINQADADMHSDLVRSTMTVNGHPVDGTGVIIGLISDSFHDTPEVGTGTVTGTSPILLTKTIPQQSGNLPATVEVVDFGTGGGTDEGEAMTEEAFHIAPSATFAFASAGNADTDFAGNITKLKTVCNAKVICDDVGYFDEPFFQDGPIAQAANNFVTGGGIYLSACGNDQDSGIMMPFNGSATAADTGAKGARSGATFHDWGIGGATPTFLPIDLAGSGAQVTIIMQWNQPFHSFGLGQGSKSDYDVYLFSDPTVNAANVQSSTDVQGNGTTPSGDPIEILQFVTQADANRYYLAVDRFAGSPNAFLRILILSDGAATLTSPFYSTVLGKATIFGHAAAAKVLAVAAVPWNTPDTLETFSSLGGYGAGGLPFYFDNTGNLLAGAPQLRNKPDVTAPDGVTTSNDNFAPFFGTSAAVPNAAATEVLAWSANPGHSNTQIITAMVSTCTDIINAPASLGADDASGAGLVNAYRTAGGTMAAPVINSGDSALGFVNAPFAYLISATNNPTDFSASNLPDGLTVDADSGYITGIPTKTGSATIAVAASNAGGTGIKVVQVSIVVPTPKSTTTTTSGGTTGQAGVIDTGASGGGGNKCGAGGGIFGALLLAIGLMRRRARRSARAG